MATPEPKNANWKDWIFVATAMVGILAAFGTWIGGIGLDVATRIFYITLLIAFLLFSILPPSFTRKSSRLVLGDGSAAQLPAISKKLRLAGNVGTPILACGILPLIIFWNVLFPFVKLDNVIGSELADGIGNNFLFKPPYRVYSLDKKTYYEAHQALTFTLTRTTSTKMRVKAIRVYHKPFNGIPGTTIMGTFPANVTGMNRFKTTLRTSSDIAECQMVIDGKLTDGILSLNEAQPCAKLHIDFSAEKGGYFVVFLEVVLVDEYGGRERILRSDTSCMVYAHES